MHRFPKDKKKDIFAEISKKAKDPDPTSYSPKHEEIHKKFWEKPNGSFLKSKRETVTEEACRLSPKKPGPGQYQLIHKGASQPLPKPLLGKFK